MYITFISKGWGGCTSDKHITEHSGFLKHLRHGDVILADRGFNIEELLGSVGASQTLHEERVGYHH